MCVSLHLMLLDGRAHCALTKKIPPSFNLLIRSQPLIHQAHEVYIHIFSLFALSRVTPQFVCVSLGLPRRCLLFMINRRNIAVCVVALCGSGRAATMRRRETVTDRVTGAHGKFLTVCIATQKAHQHLLRC
jgi:hypothetical protein